MILEVKTYKIICDGCRKSEIVFDSDIYDPVPDGWQEVRNHFNIITAHYCKNCRSEEKKV